MAAGAASSGAASSEDGGLESALKEWENAVRDAEKNGFFEYRGSVADMREEHNARVLRGEDNPAGLAKDNLRRARKRLVDLKNSKATVDGPLASYRLREIEAKIAKVKADIAKLEKEADPLFNVRQKEKLKKLLEKFLVELEEHLSPDPRPLTVGVFVVVSIDRFILLFGRRDETIVKYAEEFLSGIIDAGFDMTQDENSLTFKKLPCACFFAWKDFLTSIEKLTSI